jgi:Bacterial DNA-binding protein
LRTRGFRNLEGLTWRTAERGLCQVSHHLMAAIRISAISGLMKLQGNNAMTAKIKKGRRIGRNPKTGTKVLNSPRRVIVFTPSAILKQRINGQAAVELRE